MRFQKQLLALVLLLGLVSGFLFLAKGKMQSADAGPFALVKVYENLTSDDGNSRIVIVYGPDDTETINLVKATHRNLDRNGERVLEALEKVHARGYSLVSTHGGDNLTTYVFQK